jgi:putative transposase
VSGPRFVVEARTCAQGARIAAATGGTQLAKAQRDGTTKLGRRVDVGVDLEAARGAVQAVSVLFTLFELAPDGVLTQVSSGWTVTAGRFEVEWPGDLPAASLVRSHFGARRFAFNWALGQVKADLSAHAGERAHQSVPWTLAGLRKAFNLVKGDVAPWWAANSKEAYACGVTDAATALGNWDTSRRGVRKGARVGFPRFKSKARDTGRVRFTTGAMRLEADRRTIVLPVVGRVRSKENTRRVERHVRSGRAQVLSMTLSEQWGRLFVSVSYALRTAQPAAPQHPSVRAGVDLGMRTLATISTIDLATGATGYWSVPNRAPLRATMNARRRGGHQLSRRIPGSNGHTSAKATLTKLDRRAVHLRQEAAHQLTSSLVGLYGHVVIEDLNVAAMKKSMGRRAFRRAVCDASMGAIRPMLTYKTTRAGTVLTVVDRWYPSSQLHHGCVDPDATPCRLVAKHKMDKILTCPVRGVLVDRDLNAADNLRDWPDLPVVAQLEPRPRLSAVPPAGVGTAAQTPSSTGGLRSGRKTRPSGQAVRGEARTEITDSSVIDELRKECA